MRRKTAVIIIVIVILILIVSPTLSDVVHFVLLNSYLSRREKIAMIIAIRPIEKMRRGNISNP